MVTREIVEKFADAQKIIQSIYPSLISFYAMCEKRERKGITMRLDTRTGRCPVIEYNSEFIAVITKEVLAALISVELIRLLLHHPTGRLLLPAEVCYQASNIVCTRKEILNWNIAQYTQDHFPTVDDIEKEPGFNVAEDMYLERVFSILMNRIERNSQKQQQPKDKKGKKTQQSDDAEESIGQSQDKPKNGTDKQKFRGDKESEDADNTKEDKNADKKADKQQKGADKKQGDKSDEKDGQNEDGESGDSENAEIDEDVANSESDASNSDGGKKNSQKSKKKGNNPGDNDKDEGDEDSQDEDDESDEDGESNEDGDEDGDDDSTGENKSSKGKSGGKSKGKSNDEQSLDDDMQPSDGNDQRSNGNSQQSNDDEMSHFDDMEQALDKHFSRKNMKKSTESWGENGIIDQKITNQLQREKSNLKSWGTMPADLKEMIDRANMIKIDPRAVLKRFARSVFSTIPFFTRRKPSKKDVNQEWRGYMQGKTYQQRARVLFAIDSSGSMEEEQLQKAVAFVMSAIKHAEVYFCWWDCICTPFTRLKTPKPAVELSGGGGTNPQCVLDYAKTQKMRFDGVVFITDCYFHWPKPETKEHIFIMRTDDATTAPDWCKWVLSFKDIEHR